ncbi:Pex2/Pex12 amino terminal region protein [Toxoplasma gondii MAS]|uniref:Peroxin-12 n=2 Tax=Toxoplasma gondii TaxID=5811 RepID=A0A086QTZ3_TOXGO|nr:Pex2/Pex12 amino terminal region protein [Toxoplasma gondii MAS]PUA90614.1 Pex2/Pex12 amino terminal region protein [Toxoplasma gondii TgCATBr9]
MEDTGAVFSTTLYPPPHSDRTPALPSSALSSSLQLDTPGTPPGDVSRLSSGPSRISSSSASLPLSSSTFLPASSSKPSSSSSPASSPSSSSSSPPSSSSFFSSALAQQVRRAAAPQQLGRHRIAQLLLLLLSRSSLQQPSFFEVLAQQKLLEGLLSALQHCVDVLRDQLESDELLGQQAEVRRQSDDERDGGSGRHAGAGERREKAGRRKKGERREKGGEQKQGTERGKKGQVARGSASFVAGIGESVACSWLGRCWGNREKRLLGNAVAFLKHARDQVTSRRVCLWMLRHWEIFFGVFLAGVEWQSLVTSSASFAERFYGLQRLDKSFLSLASLPFALAAPVPASEVSRDPHGLRGDALVGEKSQINAQLARPLSEETEKERDAVIKALLACLERGGRTHAGGLGLRRRQVLLSLAFLLLPLLRREIHAAYLRSVRTLDSPASSTLDEFFSENSLQDEEEAEEQRREEEERKRTEDSRESHLPLSCSISSSCSSSQVAAERARILCSRFVSLFSRALNAVWRFLRSRLRRMLLFLHRLWRLRRRLFVRLYSPACGLHSLVCFVYMLLYLADATKFPYWSPYMHILGLIYIRSPLPSSPFSPFFPLFPQTSAAPQGGAQAAAAVSRHRAALRGRCLELLVNTGARVSKLSLTALVLALRLLEWWRDYEAAAAAASRPDEFSFAGLGASSRGDRYTGEKDPDDIPAPLSPLPDDGEENGYCVPLPQDDRICPLCHRPRTNAACLPTGYVFCYRCLVNFVRTHNRCPVSGRRASEKHIRRLYEV